MKATLPLSIAIAGLLAGCANPETPRIEKAIAVCAAYESKNNEVQTDGDGKTWTPKSNWGQGCSYSKQDNYHTFNITWATGQPLGDLISVLELPPPVLTKIENTKPIDGAQEAEYRDAKITWSYSSQDFMSITQIRSFEITVEL